MVEMKTSVKGFLLMVRAREEDAQKRVGRRTDWQVEGCLSVDKQTG